MAGAARIIIAHTYREAFRNYEYFTNTSAIVEDRKKQEWLPCIQSQCKIWRSQKFTYLFDKKCYP